MLDDFQEHGPVLAVVDGRFLPVHYFKLNADNNVKTVQTIGGDSLDMTTTASSIDVGIRTRRRPHVRSLLDQNVYIRNRKYKIIIENPHIERDGATMDGFDATYDIELSADSYTIKTANESFL